MKYTLTKILAILFVIISGISACRSSEPATQPSLQSEVNSTSPLEVMLDTSRVFSSNFTGFALYDPASDSMIYARNEDRYFTPASNTKLFTFYTGLKLLPDSIKALEYEVRGDSLIFWGTGDPSFLHPDFGNDKVYEFLKNREEKLYFSDSNFEDELLGPGWSWSDYQYYYQTEKYSLPMYGSVVRFTVQEIESQEILKSENGLSVAPAFFRSHIKNRSPSGQDNPLLHRAIDDNRFEYRPKADTTRYTIDKPFHYSPQLVTDMLSDTLARKVEYVDAVRPDVPNVLYSIASDTAYKRMLQPSDNFIAEQLLLVAASEMGEPLNAGTVIDRIKAEYLDMLPQEPQWVDGSGLSRYNMVTPASIIRLLRAIDEEFEDDEQLFALLPAGGERGTIENWYGSRTGGPPYVFAKTGTLSNNHTLSGYLITKTGNKLLFSFMNNHYVSSSSVVKEEMEKVLWFLSREL